MELHYADADGAAEGEKAVKATITLARDRLKNVETLLKDFMDKPTASDAGQ
ncbi:MAG: hypothetical protein U0792_06895 [Gemmataceae bacterium]